MRIQITVEDRRQIIDTTNPELAGRWLWEHVVPLMSMNAYLPNAEIQVIPSTHEEHVAFNAGINAELSRAGLLKLAEAILKALPDDA